MSAPNEPRKKNIICHKALFQSSSSQLTLIILSDLSCNYVAWEAANYVLWKVPKFLAEIQYCFHQCIPYTTSPPFKSGASDDRNGLFKRNMNKTQRASVTDRQCQTVNKRGKEKLTQQERNSAGNVF